MNSRGYKKFKFVFHAILCVFSIGLIVASIIGWNEMNRALLYLLLGLAFACESIFVLGKYYRQKTQ